MTRLPRITKNFYFSLFVMGCILFIGGTLVEDSEVGGFVVVVSAFVIGHTLLEVLDTRERRRKEKEQETPTA